MSVGAISRPLTRRSSGWRAREALKSATPSGSAAAVPAGSSCGATLSTAVNDATSPRMRIAFDQMPESSSEP